VRVARIVEQFVSAELMARGVDLAIEGSENYGWLRDDALKVVEQAEEAGLLVLGGNVWISVEGRYRPAHDNWYCQSSSEQGGDVARCARSAREYISSYRQPAGEPRDWVLFEIVCRR
jgi:hypothetical protein